MNAIPLRPYQVMTENYSGAEIEGVCRAAASSAFDRNIKVAGGGSFSSFFSALHFIRGGLPFGSCFHFSLLPFFAAPIRDAGNHLTRP